jgi:hypothetical protein
MNVEGDATLSVSVMGVGKEGKEYNYKQASSGVNLEKSFQEQYMAVVNI